MPICTVQSAKLYQKIVVWFTQNAIFTRNMSFGYHCDISADYLKLLNVSLCRTKMPLYPEGLSSLAQINNI